MKGKNTKNTKKTNQSERISIRCTKKVKDDFTRRMKKGRYETQVEFIVDALKTMDDKEKIERNNAHFCCVMQDILNHWNTRACLKNKNCTKHVFFFPFLW